LKNEVLQDEKLQKIIAEIQQDPRARLVYEFKQGVFLYEGRLVLSSNSSLIPSLLQEFHSTPQGGHSGFYKTYRRLAASVYWVGMKGTIQEFVRACDVCQRQKYLPSSPGALVQPLPEGSHVHPVFHVSLLKKVVGQYHEDEELSDLMEGEQTEIYEPEAIVATRKIKLQAENVSQVLVHWKGKSAEEVTWEDTIRMRNQFPLFNLGDKVIPEEDGIDRVHAEAEVDSPHAQLVNHATNGPKSWIVYTRRGKKGNQG
jgi:hypothetical protein